MKLQYQVVFKIVLAAGLACLLPPALFSQEFRGTISGAVTDGTGGTIAGAKITVTETHTNTKVETVTESTGQYSAPFLLPGDYDIAAKMPGFKEFIRKGVHLGAGEHPVIDMRLDVGETTTSVEVTADVPLVNSENASIGHAITTKEVEDLPLNGGSPWMLSQLEIGVIYSPFNSNSSVQQTYDSSNNFSIAGTPTQSSEMLLNGAPNATWDMRSAYTPPKDAVQEVRTTVLNTDASFGHTRGGTINMVMKTGTNELHGSMWENMQPSNLTANSFFNNAKGLGNPLTHYNQYGLTAGGPVYLPKVFNGKDKLFWFFAWQHDKNTQPFTSFISVPTDAEKRGDFSQILQTDGTQLYDPFSATPQRQRDCAPAASRQSSFRQARINPITQQYLKFFPAPNVVGVSSTSRPDGYFNYGTTAPNTNIADNQSLQLDYNMSNRSRMSFNVRHNTLDAKKNDYFQNIASGTITSRENWGGSVDEVYTLSPTSILNLRLNYTYMAESSTDSEPGLRPHLAWLSQLHRRQYRAPVTALRLLRYQHGLSVPRLQPGRAAAVAVRPGLRQLDQDHGQPQHQGRHRSAPEPLEHHHLRLRRRRVQFRRQPLGQPERQRLRHRSHGPGYGAVPLRPAHPGLLRHQHLRLLVLVLRLRLRAGRLARQAQPHPELRPALRLRWSRQ